LFWYIHEEGTCEVHGFEASESSKLSWPSLSRHSEHWYLACVLLTRKEMTWTSVSSCSHGFFRTHSSHSKNRRYCTKKWQPQSRNGSNSYSSLLYLNIPSLRLGRNARTYSVESSLQGMLSISSLWKRIKLLVVIQTWSRRGKAAASARPWLQEANASASIFFSGVRGKRFRSRRAPLAIKPESLYKVHQKTRFFFELSPAAAVRHSQSATVYTESPPKTIFFFWEFPGSTQKKNGLSRLNSK